MSTRRRDFLAAVTGAGLAASSFFLFQTVSAAEQSSLPEALKNDMPFKFGQPPGGISHISYVVEDIHRAMERFTRTLHVGPWFFAESAQLKNGIYRGQPWQFQGSFANGNTGYLQIELIHQADDAPSPYTEVIKKRGYGLHHQGIAVRDFDAQLKVYAALGYEIAADSGGTGPGRAVYVDTQGEFPFFVEVTEISKSSEAMFREFYQASVRWDGKDPIRVVK